MTRSRRPSYMHPVWPVLALVGALIVLAALLSLVIVIGGAM